MPTTIKSENWDGVSAPAIPSGWAVSAGLTTDATNPSSAPNDLAYLASNVDAAVVQLAVWNATDGFGGDSQIATKLRWEASASGQILLVLRKSTASATDWGAAALYYFSLNLGLVQIERHTPSETGLFSVAPASLPLDIYYYVQFKAEGSGPVALSARVQRLDTNQWFQADGSWGADNGAGNWTITATDSSGSPITGAGYGGVAFYQNSAATQRIDDFLFENLNSSTPTFTSSPTSVHINTTGNILNLIGTGTAWDGTTTFSVTGGTGAAITTQSVTDATHATLHLTAGSTAATLTLADTTDAATAPVTAISYVPYTDPGIFYSPGTWYTPSGAACMQANVSGAYLRTILSGTSLSVDLDVSPMVTAGLSAGDYPVLTWSLDSGAWQTAQLSSGTTSLLLGTGLSSGAHSLVLYVRFVGNGDDWTPHLAVRIQGFYAGAVTAPAFRSKRLLAYGDSITESGNANTLAGMPSNTDPWAHFVADIAAALDCEWANVGNSGQGWTITGANSEPPFHTPGNSAQTAWDKFDAGNSRLVGGVFNPPYDYLLVMHGNNDAGHGATDAAVTAAVPDWLTQVRLAHPAPRPIFVLIAFGRFKAAAVQAGFDAWGGGSSSRTIGAATIHTAASDAHVYLIDLGAWAAEGLIGTTSLYAFDGVHPSVQRHGQLGAAVAQAMATLSGGGRSSVFAPIGCGFIKGL